MFQPVERTPVVSLRVDISMIDDEERDDVNITSEPLHVQVHFIDCELVPDRYKYVVHKYMQ